MQSTLRDCSAEGSPSVIRSVRFSFSHRPPESRFPLTIESALDELKTHLRGSKIVLRSKTPDLVRQEFYGLMMAHYAIRSVMLEAALKVDEDPDRLSFILNPAVRSTQ